LARTLVKLGRWVAAAELYLEATRLVKDRNWQSTQDDAIRDAERERGELLPRIPRLKILVQGADPEGVTLKIDGTEVPSALIGIDQLVNPGECRIQAIRGEDMELATVQMSEGAHEMGLRVSPQALSSYGGF
jgi:hypothetical protein